MSTKLLPITLVISSSLPTPTPYTFTTLTPAFSITRAVSLSILPPASMIISPVLGSITSSAATVPASLVLIASFLLYLYLPTLARSYLLASKKRALSSCCALSTVGGSPGLSFLYISLSPSSKLSVASFSRVFISLVSSPKISIIS